MSSSETAAKKDVQKLQRAIVDGLEDVKAQDIQVFDTEQLSSLFERVIIASGTSNRQTKALAASVVDAVRDAGFVKPRIEGEENGEWIIVDGGAAVAHSMQPSIRQYYRLEEIWGGKPVRLKFGAAKPAEPVKAVAAKAPAKPKNPELGPSLRRSSAMKTAERQAKQAAEAKTPAKKAAVKKAPAKQAAGGLTAKKAPAKSAASKVPVVKIGIKPSAKPAGKAPARKAAPKKA